MADEPDDLDDPGSRRQRRQEEEKGEEPQKSYETILEQQIQAGVTELERPASNLFLSGLSAGLDVSLSLLLMATMRALTEGTLPHAVSEILVANMYAAGFLFVVLGRSELFTEHTTLAVLPVLDRRASLAQLGRLWGLIYAANLIGAAAFAAFASFIAPRLGIAEPRIFGGIAAGLVGHPGWVILLSGILAGWLMGLLSWLVAASRDTIGQIFIVWLVTFAIGITHLHHSIVGTAEVLAGVFSGQGADLADFGRFLLFATLGNVIGGFVFVALIKWGHAHSKS
jgi:formate/nitrite transporter FocA (FNT family)